MANKKALIKSKKRTLYLEEELFNKFTKILQENGRSVGDFFNKQMKIVVTANEAKNYDEVEKSIAETMFIIDKAMEKLVALKNVLSIKKDGAKHE